MCISCYKAIPPPPVAPRARVLNFHEQWTCYPVSGAMQLVPPPPPAPAAPAPPPAKRARPTIAAGASYIYPLKHTQCHVIRDIKVWEKPEQDFAFKIHKVPTSLSVDEFMQAICGGGADDAKDMVCTEVRECGDGCWEKEAQYTYGDADKNKATLSSLGWDERRGSPGGRPPVWLVIHEK